MSATTDFVAAQARAPLAKIVVLEDYLHLRPTQVGFVTDGTHVALEPAGEALRHAVVRSRLAERMLQVEDSVVAALGARAAGDLAGLCFVRGRGGGTAATAIATATTTVAAPG